MQAEGIMYLPFVLETFGGVSDDMPDFLTNKCLVFQVVSLSPRESSLSRCTNLCLAHLWKLLQDRSLSVWFVFSWHWEVRCKISLTYNLFYVYIYIYIIFTKHLFSCFTILICIFFLPRHELHWFSEVLKSKNKNQRRKGKKIEIRKGGRKEARKQESSWKV